MGDQISSSSLYSSGAADNDSVDDYDAKIKNKKVYPRKNQTEKDEMEDSDDVLMRDEEREMREESTERERSLENRRKT